MVAVAEMGRPISPSSMAFRAVWIPVPSTVSGAQPNTTHAARAASSTCRASAVVAANGFSP